MWLEREAIAQERFRKKKEDEDRKLREKLEQEVCTQIMYNVWTADLRQSHQHIHLISVLIALKSLMLLAITVFSLIFGMLDKRNFQTGRIILLRVELSRIPSNCR